MRRMARIYGAYRVTVLKNGRPVIQQCTDRYIISLFAARFNQRGPRRSKFTNC
ncbi:hypothetical protein HMPREF3293_00224 [Christensenella minuta]|uniref:Uncharacterized protein n=1 Tax=Christensenella minuta TaxID=626937 RepID=A0A136Q8C2_9FIRM|nr:hypothetical protein HMPREF3293_00224 [Christensenella minuta]